MELKTCPFCGNEFPTDAPTIIPADDEPNIDEAMADFEQYCEMYEPTYDPDTGAM